jgi:hypothetical protein
MRVSLRWAQGNFAAYTETNWVCVKAPWNEPLYSERYGGRKPLVKVGGWRMFARKRH